MMNILLEARRSVSGNWYIPGLVAELQALAGFLTHVTTNCGTVLPLGLDRDPVNGEAFLVLWVTIPESGDLARHLKEHQDEQAAALAKATAGKEQT